MFLFLIPARMFWVEREISTEAKGWCVPTYCRICGCCQNKVAVVDSKSEFCALLYPPKTLIPVTTSDPPPLPQIRCCTTTGKTNDKSTSSAGLNKSWKVAGWSRWEPTFRAVAADMTTWFPQKILPNTEINTDIRNDTIIEFFLRIDQSDRLLGHQQVLSATQDHPLASSPRPWMYSEGYLRGTTTGPPTKLGSLT